MPGRTMPLITDQIYHIFNKGIAGQPIFFNKKDYKRFIDTFSYYIYTSIQLRFSKYLLLSVNKRSELIKNLYKSPTYVSCYSFCIMPNHFHFLLKQNTDSGIANYISKICNSYTRYINTKYKKQGPILQGKFKAVLIENEEQLLHVSRYIHLNPYTSYYVKTVQDALSYPNSSMCLFINKNKNLFLSKEEILDQFNSVKSFIKFTVDNADYQKKLHTIKHLIFN